MAKAALGFSVLRELLRVNIGVTCSTASAGEREVNLHQPGFWILRFVTIRALCEPVSAAQRERCLGVIKTGKIVPGCRGMADFASRRSATGCCGAQHSVKAPGMRIVVTGPAGQILPVVPGGCLLLETRWYLVAIHAWGRDVSATQGERGFIVLMQTKRGRPKSFKIVAILATVEIRKAGELPGMLVDVTIGTVAESDCIDSRSAFWDMTLGAP